MKRRKQSSLSIPDEIFLKYDIRGIAHETLTPDVAYKIGQAFGTVSLIQNIEEITVASDARLSSPTLESALIAGVCSTGCDVVRIGTVPTPILYFATKFLATGTGLMVTASHNPAEYNGVKMLLSKHTLHGENIQRLKRRIIDEEFFSGEGTVQDFEIEREYFHAITCSTQLVKPLRVVIDCANGIAGDIAPRILRNIGCEVIELYCEIDGTFPNHSPDPTQPENLEDLIALVIAKDADIGIALDGDADRLVAVSPSGEIIWPDRLMILFARQILDEHPNRNVVFDVKCGRALEEEISRAGGNPVMSMTGHALVKSKMMECDAIFGGEMSGHLYFRDRWTGYDDGIYAAARLCEFLDQQNQTPLETFDSLPQSCSTPEIRIPCPNPQDLVDSISNLVDFEFASVSRPGWRSSQL